MRCLATASAHFYAVAANSLNPKRFVNTYLPSALEQHWSQETPGLSTLRATWNNRCTVPADRSHVSGFSRQQCRAAREPRQGPLDNVDHKCAKYPEKESHSVLRVTLRSSSTPSLNGQKAWPCLQRQCARADHCGSIDDFTFPERVAARSLEGHSSENHFFLLRIPLTEETPCRFVSCLWIASVASCSAFLLHSLSVHSSSYNPTIA